MPIYIPKIKDYAPFYMQQEGAQSASNIQTDYGVTVKQHPFPMHVKVKEPYKNDWKDRDGDDEYMGDIYLEPIELTYDCVIMSSESSSDAARAEIYARVRAFMTFVSKGEMRIYDDWNKFGFRRVRLVEIQEVPPENYKATIDGKARVIFTMTLKVNDPATQMVLSNGAIVVKTTNPIWHQHSA